jgi:hypothetical protein
MSVMIAYGCGMSAAIGFEVPDDGGEGVTLIEHPCCSLA